MSSRSIRRRSGRNPQGFARAATLMSAAAFLAALRGYFDLVLPEQVITEARRHLDHPAQAEALQFFLASSGYEEVPMPPADVVSQHSDVVRSDKEVPIALALLVSDVDVFVTSDRDFTEPDATAQRFRERVRVMLPAVFLREVLGWDADALEAIRHRTWQDLLVEERDEESAG